MIDMFSVPAVYSVSGKLPRKISGSEITHSMTCLLEDLQRWAICNKYLVGHIKAFAGDVGHNLRLSVTKGQVSIKYTPGWPDFEYEGLTIAVTAIVYGPESTALRQTAVEMACRWIPGLYNEATVSI